MNNGSEHLKQRNEKEVEKIRVEDVLCNWHLGTERMMKKIILSNFFAAVAVKDVKKKKGKILFVKWRVQGELK